VDAPQHDIVVVSDLHLGRGLNPNTRRYFRLEAFFYDDDFEQFCKWLVEDADTRRTSFKLVFNGDTFDLLRIEPEEPQPGASMSIRRYGPLITPATAAYTMADILEGHPNFVRGVARVLAAGHRVVFLPGNHDRETQWQPVQNCVRRNILKAVRGLGGEQADVDRASERLLFEPWFHHEPGRIWIEHGNQYDPDNAFECHLRSNVDREALPQTEQDSPIGSFFQRYLYNQFGSITFIVPSGRANVRYFRWLLINKPRLLARVATSHFPYFIQVLRRIAKSGGKIDRLKAQHDAELDALAESSKLGDTLHEIDKLKVVRGGAAVFGKGIVRRVLKVAGMFVLLTILMAGLWSAGSTSINQIDAGVGLKAGLFLSLTLIFLVLVMSGIAFLLLRPATGPPNQPLHRAARFIGSSLNVPIVTFGHTHDEVVFPVDDDKTGKDDPVKQWYFNTGTWIAVFTHDQLLPRERVQYTFLRVRGNDAQLLYWSPGRRQAVPVVLIEDLDRFGSARPTDAHAD